MSMEFDRFKGSQDRLDLLAVDRKGNLVVVELKRNSHADYADLQSIRYAAMVSTMTVEQLLPYYADYHKTATGTAVAEEELRSNIVDFVELEDFEEFSSHPVSFCAPRISPKRSAPPCYGSGNSTSTLPVSGSHLTVLKTTRSSWFPRKSSHYRRPNNM